MNGATASMNNFWTLTKLNLRQYLIPRFENKKQKRNYLLTYGVVGFFIVVMLGFLMFALYHMMKAMDTAENAANLLGAVLFMGQFLILFFGTFGYIQIMYFSKDNMILAPLPIKQSAIFASRLITALVSEYLISFFVVVPTCIVSAVAYSQTGARLGAEFYALFPVAFLFLPFVPVLIVSILSFPIMKLVTYFKKHPTLGALVTCLLTVGIFVAIYVPMMRLNMSMSGSEPSEEIDILVLLAPILKIGKYYFPTGSIASAMFGVKPFPNSMIYIGTALAGLVIALVLSKMLYGSIISRSLEGGGNTVKRKKDAVDRRMSPVLSYAVKDLKCILRDQAVAVQSLIMLLMAPVMVLVFGFLFGRTMGAAGEEGMDVSGVMPGMLLMLGVTFCGTNTLAYIAFSRERETFYLLKTYPVNLDDIVKAKVLLADAVTVLTALLMAICFAVSVKADWIFKLLFVFPPSIIGCSLNAFAVRRDLKNPRTHWTNIKEISNNRMSNMIPMLICMLAGVVFILLAAFLPSVLPGWRGTLTFWCVAAFICAIYYFVFRFGKLKNCAQYFETIE